MQITLDFERCEGHGECVIAAPEIFDLDEENDKAVLLDAEPGEHLRESATDAVSMCPVAALSLVN